MSQTMQVAVIVPPMTQLNAPYAALPALCAWVRRLGHEALGLDLSLRTALALFSPDGLRRVFDAVAAQGEPDDATALLLDQRRRYEQVIAPAIAFLHGREPGLAGRIVRQSFLPAGPRAAEADAEQEAALFGVAGITDQARLLCTWMLQDLADLVQRRLSPHFGLLSYAARLGETASDYAPIAAHLAAAPDLVESLMLEQAAARIPAGTRLAAITCPFPGNLLASLRLAQWLKRERPGCLVAVGGGFPSAALRGLREARIFDVVDAVCLDDGEAALAGLIARALGDEAAVLPSCFTRVDGAVRFIEATAPPPRHADLPAPDYAGLHLDDYIDLLDQPNPMQRLWNEGRWLRLATAHGCYHKRCTFCDTGLPYIGRYDAAPAAAIADRMEAMAAQTGRRTFHLIDEAAPPAVITGLARELLRRGRPFTWWGNIRFEKHYTPDRCRLLAAGGMLAATGGLEAAQGPALERMGKGVSVAEAVRCCAALARAGILVHAYLMHGFPGQDTRATVDGLDLVRQMFRAGILHAGFWHRFSATIHSAVGRDPKAYGLTVFGPEDKGFARHNLLTADNEPGTDHERLGQGLAEAMAAYLIGVKLDKDVRAWFPIRVPPSNLAKDHVDRLIGADDPVPAAGATCCWLGGEARVTAQGLETVDHAGGPVAAALPETEASAWAAFLRAASPDGEIEAPTLPADLAKHPLLPGLHAAGLVGV